VSILNRGFCGLSIDIRGVLLDDRFRVVIQRDAGPRRGRERDLTVRGAEPGWGESNTLVVRVADLVAGAMDHPWNFSQISDALSADNAILVTRESGQDEGRGQDSGENAVDPERRRLGIGGEILAQFLSREAAEGVVEVRLEMSSENVPARALYESKGFVVVGRRARYYPDGADALLFTWRAQTEN
jgi:GNAT superfamily N-acetyltransferase